ncbi:MAG: MFS transporter, partial [Caldilineae bacterium]
MASTADAAPAEESTATEPTTLEKLRGLRWSIAANVANTVFVQYTFFGSIFVLFLDELGLNKSQIGFLLSLLPFAGLISLIVAPAVARFGYKRTYLTFWTARSVVAAFLLLTPWIVLTYGEAFTLVFISVIVAAFAILRAVGMTANMPWVQEFVPDAMRGKYTATSNMFTSIAGFVAISVGGFVLSRATGLPGFIALISVGVLAGFVSVAFQSFVPGGAPVPKSSGQRRDVGAALRDVNFRRYLFVVALLVLGTVPLNSFVPLYMREEIGLQAGSVVFLQVGTLTGSVLSSYAWGWAADRFGSRPVVLWGLVLRAITPILWMLMPREAPLSLYVALGIAFIRGVSDMGWGIGSARLLYVSIVPPEKRSDYLALYNGWIGVAGGLAQVLGGRIVDVAQSLGGNIFFLALSPYTPLFISGFVLTGAALTLMGRIHADERVGMGEFVGIFFRGNPFLAMTSMIRFHLASSEPATVQLTERLGQAKSRLAVEELLEALVDPRFNVRFEAIVSIARMPPEPRLTQALIDILNGSEVALSTIAAWALGRMGDPAAYEALIQGLDADFRSIQVHCARALGALGKREAIPILLERLRKEENVGLQMAFASALGNLQAEEATEDILALLERMENEGARLELALSLARIAGDEGVFVNLARSARTDPGTAFAQA